MSGILGMKDFYVLSYFEIMPKYRMQTDGQTEFMCQYHCLRNLMTWLYGCAISWIKYIYLSNFSGFT